MRRSTLFLGLCLLLTWAAPVFGHPHILDTQSRQEVEFSELVDDLSNTRLVFIGELHDHDGHHQAQLEIIRTLHEAGVALAIGLEMFRSDSQDQLDLWVANHLTERKFKAIYEQNWSMWERYRDIFVYARDFEVPMVGLNISRDITRQVAEEGFASLSADQSQELKGIACNVDPAYMDYIRRAMGGHGNHGKSFVYFCEAQLVWDSIMAKNLAEYLEQNPERTIVVLAGSGHNWKYGIPSQLQEYHPYPYKVILPEIIGRVDRTNATATDADYLWLDVGEDGWSAP
ncbi:hypothetical protein DESUT3_21580 [Desulfuromonas versatilis]|uniref:Haem-binding uptake Tiki superfamily ChaN domain-containing protein n=1 Tax=Desulfuromonas versatilis TaxID=2802975 RepID=A0ABN6E0U4_9BACT|nr:ChaN family lipoprotein [Desulfuromonas versatilis]BCR05089.1 hypothetical protein DESUT3_21580 [Desulfuromonas versatilis]